MSPERIKFVFDPRCPWCYRTSRWAVRLEELGQIAITWGLFSLDVVNAKEGTDLQNLEAESGAALRTVIALRKQGQSELVRSFYSSLGKRVWEADPPELDFAVASRAALSDLGLDPALCDEALADNATWLAVIEEHQLHQQRAHVFGVPFIVLDDGAGPAMFGPIISDMPSDEVGIELWQHASWLIRNENFSELKRVRLSRPDFPGSTVRRQQRQHREEAQLRQ